MFLSRGKEPKAKISTPSSSGTREEISGTAIEMRQASLFPAIQTLNMKIHRGSWVILDGPDSLGIALFCDLCFGFLEPDAGKVISAFQSSDVTFLGRSATTYGKTLLDHLVCSTSGVPRELVLEVAQNIFTDAFIKNLPTQAPGLLRFQAELSTLDLCERDFLELSEANAILQNRPALVVDTTSDFYQQALAQGFQHSKLFLESAKTIIWIVDQRLPYLETQAPWNKKRSEPTLNLYFSHEPRRGGIN